MDRYRFLCETNDGIKLVLASDGNDEKQARKRLLDDVKGVKKIIKLIQNDNPLIPKNEPEIPDFVHFKSNQ